MRIYIAVGAMTAVYQGLCLLIVPFLFAIKRLMNIQLAVCVSLLQGISLFWRDAAPRKNVTREEMEGGTGDVNFARGARQEASILSLLVTSPDAKVRVPGLGDSVREECD